MTLDFCRCERCKNGIRKCTEKCRKKKLTPDAITFYINRKVMMLRIWWCHLIASSPPLGSRNCRFKTPKINRKSIHPAQTILCTTENFTVLTWETHESMQNFTLNKMDHFLFGANEFAISKNAKNSFWAWARMKFFGIFDSFCWIQRKVTEETFDQLAERSILRYRWDLSDS